MKEKLLFLVVTKLYKISQTNLFRIDAEISEKVLQALDLMVQKLNDGKIGIESKEFLIKRIEHFKKLQTEEILKGDLEGAILTQRVLDSLEAKYTIHYGN